MKTRIFTTLAIICAICTVVSFNAVKADVITIGSELGNWGTVFSDVEDVAYHHKYVGDGTLTDPVYNSDGSLAYYKVVNGYSLKNVHRSSATWEYDKVLLEDYLRNTLANATLSTGSSSTGILHGTGHTLVTHASDNVYDDIYGKKAELIKGNAVTSGVAEQLFRNGALTATNILTSSASPALDGTTHNWFFDATKDTFTSNSTITSNGVGDYNDGLYAFVTSFDYNQNAVYQYLNGWFSELGDLLGIYINGVELSSDYLRLSNDYLASDLFGSFDMEIDLAKLFADGVLKAGNNNISFLLDTIVPVYSGGTLYDENDGLVAFASGLNLNSESIFSSNPDPDPQTPEPATLLIFGIGLAGLGIRRKLMSKKS
jgi:hypothetical protein